MNKFGDIIRTQREAKKLLLRHIAAEIDIDTAMLSKIERGERRAKREQVVLLANILKLDKNELLTLWLADRVYELIHDESTALEAMKVAENEIKNNK